MPLSLLEKLQFKDETNLLIQGLPYSIERQFNKFNYSKSVTPLLKQKKVNFALLFAITKAQLKKIVPEVMEILSPNAKFWIAHPKPTSKIISDLNSKNSWDMLTNNGYEMVQQLNVDNVWDAVRFCTEIPKNYSMLDSQALNGDIENFVQIDYRKKIVEIPEDLQLIFDEHTFAQDFFESLTIENRRDFVLWIATSEDAEIRKKRINAAVEMLLDGCYNPYLEYLPE